MTDPARQLARFRRAGVLMIFAFLVVLGSCTGLDFWAGRQVDAEIVRFEARHGRLDQKELFVPSVPPEDNRARVVRAAAAMTVPLYKQVALPASGQISAELRTFAEANGSAIRLAADIRTRQQSNWDVGYRDKDRSGAALPWEGIRALSDAIYITALLDHEAGRADDAAKMIVSGLGVSASVRQEPDLLAQLMRISIAVRQLEAIRQLVTQAEPSGLALEELATWLAENREPDPAQQALLGEARATSGILERMENGMIDRTIADYIYPETWPSWPSAFLGPAARIGRPIVRLARLRYLETFGWLLDRQADPPPRPALPEPPVPKRWHLIDRLVDKFTAGIRRSVDTCADFTGALSAAEVAIGLRRYRLDRGSYPEDLSALVPQYLPSLPIDSHTGRPLAYARQGAGFTLRATGSSANVSKWMPLAWTVPR